MKRGLIKLLEILGIKELAKFIVAGSINARLGRNIKSVFSPNGSLQFFPESSQKKMLFFPVQGRPNMMVVFESLLAHALRQRDACVEMVVCDRLLSACDLPFIHNDSKLMCKGCGKSAARLCESFDLPLVRFRDFLEEEAESITETTPFKDYFDFEYEGIPIGKHVYSAVLRYTLSGTIQEDAATQAVCRRFFQNALLMTTISKNILNRLRPDSVVMHHGIYLTTGIFADYARHCGTDVVIFTPAYRKGTYLFSHDHTYHRTLQAEPNDVWRQCKVDDKAEKTLDDYLNSRRWGSQDFISYHPNPIENKETILDALDLDINKPTIGLFTNLVWDGQVVFFDNAFSSMTEWVFETIRFFLQKPDMQLIIRIHPAEVKGAVKTRQKLVPLIQKAFPQLPGHIRIIAPESDISTYTLSEFISAALVYTTKVGLEFAVKGLPVIVAGEAFYRNKGFTVDVSSQKHYFEILDTIENLAAKDPERIKLARQYAYYYFFKRFIPLNFTNNRTWNNVLSLKITSPSDLDPGKDPYLDMVCDGILNKKPFIIP